MLVGWPGPGVGRTSSGGVPRSNLLPQCLLDVTMVMLGDGTHKEAFETGGIDRGSPRASDRAHLANRN